MNISPRTLRRRERMRQAQRKYYRRNIEKCRAAQAARDAANPEKRDERNQRFEDKNPTYWRDYQRQRRFRMAWLKFTRACAASRARHSTPTGSGR